MARRAAKVDTNQGEIIDALRKAGASVQPLHGVGMGCPDILVGHRGANILMEIKDGDKPPSARRLTSWQADWHFKWEGQACVVHTIEDALEALNLNAASVPFRGTIT